MVRRTVDALDRVTFADYPETALDITYTYDGPAEQFLKGRLKSIARGGRSIDYSYDRFGRLLQDGALAFAYDANGNRVRIDYPGGVSALYTHATGPSGGTLWQGGFEPFGANWNGAQAAGVFLRFPGQWQDPTFPSSLYQNVHRYYAPGTGKYTSPDPAWSGDFHDIDQYVYALANPINFGDFDGLDYFPTFFGGGYLENQSSCPVFAFGDLGPRSPSQPIIVPAARIQFFGLMRDIGRSSFLGDIDFVCLDAKWWKIRGPAWVATNRSLHGVYHRPASTDELSRLPPCTNPPCQCGNPP